MKRKLKLIIGIVLLSGIGFLGYKFIQKLNYKKEVAQRIQTIPNFSFHNLNGQEFTQNNLPKKTIVFMYFNSECDYCKSEATKIQERLNDFKNTLLVFISFEKAKTIKEFAIQCKLYKQKNVTFLEDRKGQFSVLFDANSIPYILVYDENKKLLKKFKGATKVNKILEVLK